MARRRMVKEEQAEKPEEPLFKTPEFNETEFLQTENRNARMIYITLSVAILAGILSFALMRIVIWIGSDLYRIAPIAIPFLLLGLVYYLMLRFKVDYRELDWKKYLENGFMYIVTWGAIWIVTMNPPFTDLSGPTVSDPVLKVTGASGTSLVFEGNATQKDVVSISAFFVITDNVDARGISFDVLIQPAGGSQRIPLEPDSSMAQQLGLRTGKVTDNTSLSPDKNDTKSIRKVYGWHGSDIDDWGRNLYEVGLQNLSSRLEAFTIIVQVRSTDPSGNDVSRVFEIRIDND